jgi:hypothetical protein
VLSLDEGGGVSGGRGIERRPNWGLEEGAGDVEDGVSGKGDL